MVITVSYNKQKHTPDFDHNKAENTPVRASPSEMRGVSLIPYIWKWSFPNSLLF